MNWIRWYPYIAPVVLTPLSLCLWWRSHPGQWLVLCVAWAVPIAWAYGVPGVGTNVLKVWEFNTRWRLGRFRLHHVFVFGSATSMLVWLVHPPQVSSGWAVAQFALIEACVLGFINFIYEVKALQAQVLVVHNEAAARGLPAEAVAYDYAPWFFGGFGAAHGACLAVALWLVQAQPAWGQAWGGVLGLGALSLVLCTAVPVLGFMQASLRRHGHAGVRPVHAASSSSTQAEASDARRPQ